MYIQARLKFTALFSLIFLLLFSGFSLGIFAWFKSSLGQGYITNVREIQESMPGNPIFDIEKTQVVTTAGNIALDHLRSILLFVNLVVTLTVPFLGWYLTGKTLDPIQNAYNLQKHFVANASHEMRTPLSIMSGEMEVILKKKRDASTYKKVLKSAKEEIDRLSRLVGNLLFLAKSDASTLKSKFKRIDMTDLVSGVISNYRIKIKDKKLVVDFIPAVKPTIIWGEETMLQTLFSNLIDNAIKYTPQGGRIVIRITNLISWVRISVRDNGLGIPREHTDKIFETFYRVNLKSDIKGSGLGLTIVKLATKLHGGRISVTSRVGKGSTFTVILPKNIK